MKQDTRGCSRETLVNGGRKEDGEFTEASKNLYVRSKGLGEALWKTDRALGWLRRTPLCNVPPKLSVKCGEYGHQMLLGSYVKSKTVPVHPRSL